MKKFISIMLCLSMAYTSSVMVFASENVSNEDNKVVVSQENSSSSNNSTQSLDSSDASIDSDDNATAVSIKKDSKAGSASDLCISDNVSNKGIKIKFTPKVKKAIIYTAAAVAAAAVITGIAVGVHKHNERIASRDLNKTFNELLSKSNKAKNENKSKDPSKVYVDYQKKFTETANQNTKKFNKLLANTAHKKSAKYVSVSPCSEDICITNNENCNKNKLENVMEYNELVKGCLNKEMHTQNEAKILDEHVATINEALNASTAEEYNLQKKHIKSNNIIKAEMTIARLEDSKQFIEDEIDNLKQAKKEAKSEAAKEKFSTKIRNNSQKLSDINEEIRVKKAELNKTNGNIFGRAVNALRGFIGL